nr:hypothetical protein GCM10020241_34740 [Streptoalloteichus tenebrarius]
MATGGSRWAPDGGRPIGAGFHQFRTVLASADGQIFACGADGTIRWYRYEVSNLATGEGRWVNGAGPVIGTGFDRFPRLFGGWDGVIYGVDVDGGLWRYQYLAGDGGGGGKAWANGGSGVRIGGAGAGFKPYQHLTAGPEGVIFGVLQGGALHWYRHDAAKDRWDHGGTAVEIGGGWGDGVHKQVFSDDTGVVYAVAVDRTPRPGDDDTLMWYRLLNATTVAADGKPNWANGGNGLAVSTGFSVERTGALQGYASAWSVRPGQHLGFSVSTTHDGVTGSVLRLTGVPQPTAVGGPHQVPRALHLLPEAYRERGCGWPETIGLTVPADWASGVYALRLTGPANLRYDVPFVVRPSGPRARCAFLMPTNTYNAYNMWGGHNQYSVGEDGRQRLVTFLRPSTSTEIEPAGRISHTLYSDLLLLRWMDSNGVDYDCYVDADLDADGDWLGGYRALVLGTHPEYWSETMRQRVVDYLDAGGRLIYTGGNGFYERMSFHAGHTAAIHRAKNGDRDILGALGLSESQIIGGILSPAYMDFHPYRVVADHPLLAGTGLRPGDRFGAVAYNGAASGWEVDAVPASGVPGVEVIARGENPAGGADMLFFPKNNGGWVFSASSMSFNGALPYDAAARRILRNVFDLALR